MGDLPTVAAPGTGLYRLARRNSGPFDAPDWAFVSERETFGGRFDDPRADLPFEQRFRVIYCASDRRGVFVETLAQFRRPLSFLSRLVVLDEDEPLDVSFVSASDPEDRSRGLVRADWRLQRAMGHTALESDLRFVDLGDGRTLQKLRLPLSRMAVTHGVADVDQSLILGPSRELTQQIALHIYEQSAGDGQPLYAGIRYVSRFGQDWECWAVFADRIRHVRGMPGPPQTVHPDDPDLLAIAALFSLTIETVEGSGQYYRP
jgi:hypothetical protein